MTIGFPVATTVYTPQPNGSDMEQDGLDRVGIVQIASSVALGSAVVVAVTVTAVCVLCFKRIRMHHRATQDSPGMGK